VPEAGLKMRSRPRMAGFLFLDFVRGEILACSDSMIKPDRGDAIGVPMPDAARVGR
jgi:hypothetical protein